MRPIVTVPTGPGRPSVEVVVLNTCPEAAIIGLHAVPNRMPEIRRMPGESLSAMLRRALHEVTGSGVLAVIPIVSEGGQR